MPQGRQEGRFRLQLLLTTLSEQWPSLSYVGYGFWMGWIFLSYRSFELTRTFVGTELLHVYQTSAIATFSAALTMLIASYAWKRLDAYFEGRLLTFLAGIVASLGILALTFLAPNEIAFSIASVFIGIGTSIVCLKVGVLYSKVGLQTSIVNAAVSILFAVFLYYCGIGVPLPWRPFFIASLPLLGGVVMMLYQPQKRDDFSETKEGGAELDQKKMPLKRLLIAVSIMALISGIVSGNLITSGDPLNFLERQSMVVFLVGFCAVGMAVFVSLGKGVTQIAWLYVAFMTAEIIVLLLSLVVPEAMLYADIAKECLRVIFLCLFAYFSFRFGASAVKTYGLGQAVYLFAHTAGWLMGYNLFAKDDPTHMILGIAGAVALLITMTFVFTQSTIRSIADDFKSRENGEILQEHAFNPREPERFLVEKGLSRREIEIALLFMKGLSARWISDDLSISESTVRSHLHTIYSKLGVHSRQEFKDLFK